MNVRELTNLVHENAKAHGWWDTKPSMEEKLALIHSEISEALECYRDDFMRTVINEKLKPEGFPSEIADVVIRAMDLCAGFGLDIGTAYEMRCDDNHTDHTMSRSMCEMHHCVTTAWLCSGGSIAPSMAKLIKICERIADVFVFDLNHEILQKHEYNVTRSYRHGGKKI